jgi:TonB family protein
MRFITVDSPPAIHRLWPLAIVVCLTFAASSVAQRISILVQSDSELSSVFSQKLSERLSERKIRVDDMGLSRSAADSVRIDDTFNMTLHDARRLGSVLGTPFYILINAGNLRRTSSQVETYYEAFASIYLVSSASGRLLKWDLVSLKDSSEAKAQHGLRAASDKAGKMINDAIVFEIKAHSNSRGTIQYPPVPDDKTPGYEGLRPPMPYRRISPEYTPTANLYSVEATVEIEANVDAKGKIVSTEIVRWAGYGLDESVEETVRKMNWRPATIGTRSLPMRVLLRYNFKQLEKDDDN